MRHIFPSYAYGAGPPERCWWKDTCPDLEIAPPLTDTIDTDVAVIGGGFTGLNAALHLARSGRTVTVLEANQFGWGASGRNGGFCCLGGSTASDAHLDRRFGLHGRLEYRSAEKAAVQHVDDLINDLALDVDRHSEGETELAHHARDMGHLRASVQRVEQNYGVTPQIIEKADLKQHGMNGPFHGALTTPLGFALNPRKYVLGLARAALRAGADLIAEADATGITRAGSGWRLRAGNLSVTARQVIVATNGYSSETVPAWMAGRYMPVQSNVLVTRPLTREEQLRQGWTSAQMSFDTRNLLHYFRLMPDGRFLFGMRGGLLSSPRSDRRAAQAAVSDFRKMFPAWADADITHTWSGMVSVARNQTPFIGPVPDMPGVWAGLCYHGNGVAMGSYAGKKLASLVLGDDTPIPAAMRQPLAKFPLGAARRALMPLVYTGLMLRDF